MSKCTCPNSVCWDGIRYCPDCNTYTTAPTQDELNRRIKELAVEVKGIEDD